ncbi:hypothetical protein HMPREF0577_2271 [Mobiluncus mulieris ATCC 35243]|nr:hypothetical protein HMPREF0577_2271 [Mobiluncus mulieris ATCC 35243]
MELTVVTTKCLLLTTNLATPAPPGITRGALHAKRPSINLATLPKLTVVTTKCLLLTTNLATPALPGITPTTPGLPMSGLSPPLPLPGLPGELYTRNAPVSTSPPLPKLTVVILASSSDFVSTPGCCRNFWRDRFAKHSSRA